MNIPDSPVSRGGDEVQAAVNSVVGHLPPVNARLCVQVVLKLAVDVIGHRLPATASGTRRRYTRTEYNNANACKYDNTTVKRQVSAERFSLKETLFRL